MMTNGWRSRFQEIFRGSKISTEDRRVIDDHNSKFTAQLTGMNIYACTAISLMVCLISLSGCLAGQTPWSSRSVIPQFGSIAVYVILLSINVLFFLFFLFYITPEKRDRKSSHWMIQSFIVIESVLASLTFYSTQRGSSLFFEFILITMLIFIFPIYNPRRIWYVFLISCGGAVFVLSSAEVNVPIAWQDVCDLVIFYGACLACVIFRWVQFEKQAVTSYRLQKSKEEVYHESRTDAMTGLRNRMALREDFPCFLGKKIYAAMLDIDSFKQINDSYGHLYGDRVLKNMGECLQKVFRNYNEYCYRYGGDEFLVIAVDKKGELFHRHLCQVQRLFLLMQDNDTGITASIGYSYAEASSEKEIRHCIQRADENLYRVKSSGKGYIQGNYK